MSDELEKDYVKVEVFQHQQNCQKPHEVCEPIKVEITNIKENISALEESVRDIRNDMKAAVLWIIGLLVSGIGTFIFMLIQQHLDKAVGG